MLCFVEGKFYWLHNRLHLIHLGSVIVHLVVKLGGFHWSLHVTRATKDFGFLALLGNLSRSKIKERTELLILFARTDKDRYRNGKLEELRILA